MTLTPTLTQTLTLTLTPRWMSFMKSPLKALMDGVRTAVKQLVVGVLLVPLRCLLAPFSTSHAPLVAKGLQVTMGAAAAAKVGVSLRGVTSYSSAALLAILTCIQLPDSFGWAMKKGSWSGDRYQEAVEGVNRHKQEVERDCRATTNLVLQEAQERLEAVKDRTAGTLGVLPCAPVLETVQTALHPLLLALLRALDAIGEMVRTTPYLFIALVLQAAIFVNKLVANPPHLHVLMDGAAFSFSLSITDWIELIQALATAAAASELVRMQVKPEQHAAAKAVESAKVQQLNERSKAEARLKAIVETPAPQVDIEEAKIAIDDAEEARVLPSLIHKAVEQLQKAVEVQLMLPHFDMTPDSADTAQRPQKEVK